MCRHRRRHCRDTRFCAIDELMCAPWGAIFYEARAQLCFVTGAVGHLNTFRNTNIVEDTPHTYTRPKRRRFGWKAFAHLQMGRWCECARWTWIFRAVWWRVGDVPATLWRPIIYMYNMVCSSGNIGESEMSASREDRRAILVNVEWI